MNTTTEPSAAITGGWPKDFRTPEAKKWPEEFLPPETCGSIDDVQNALELLRDANSQLRHAAYVWKHCAEDELRRRRALAEDQSDLLAACLAMVEMYDGLSSPGDLTGITLARAAIAKAQGR